MFAAGFIWAHQTYISSVLKAITPELSCHVTEQLRGIAFKTDTSDGSRLAIFQTPSSGYLSFVLRPCCVYAIAMNPFHLWASTVSLHPTLVPINTILLGICFFIVFSFLSFYVVFSLLCSSWSLLVFGSRSFPVQQTMCRIGNSVY